MFWSDRRAYSMTFWAIFFGLVLIPLLAFSIELGRYFYAISEVQNAADAAALAAATQINQQVFLDTGTLVPSSKAWTNAQTYVSENTAGLSAKGVHAFVTGIQISAGENMAAVTVSANLSILFPSVVPDVIVSRTGVAKLLVTTK